MTERRFENKNENSDQFMGISKEKTTQLFQSLYMREKENLHGELNLYQNQTRTNTQEPQLTPEDEARCWDRFRRMRDNYGYYHRKESY